MAAASSSFSSGGRSVSGVRVNRLITILDDDDSDSSAGRRPQQQHSQRHQREPLLQLRQPGTVDSATADAVRTSRPRWLMFLLLTSAVVIGMIAGASIVGVYQQQSVSQQSRQQLLGNLAAHLRSNAASLSHSLSSQYVCEWQFARYAPSEWESQWSAQIASLLPAKVCVTLKPQQSSVFVSEMILQRWQENSPPTVQRAHKRLASIGGGDMPTEWGVERATWRAEQLMSRMHYELRCRPVPPLSSDSPTSAAATSAAASSFVLARGFDLIEPLSGLLREAYSVCHSWPQPDAETLALKKHFEGDHFWEGGGDRLQSKLFLLPLTAAPFHVEAVSEAELSSSHIPSPILSEFTRALNRTLDELGEFGTAALPPWTHRAFSSSYEQEGAGSEWPYLHRPLTPVFQSNLQIDSVAEEQDLHPTRSTSLSEEQIQTAIMLQIDSSAAAPSFKLSLPPSLSRPSAPSSSSSSASFARSSSAPRHYLFDLGASYFAGWAEGHMTAAAQAMAQGSQWFYHQMQLRDLRFDHVWAYEYEVLDPHKEWSQIPASLYAHFTFVNAGVEADPHSPANPWNTLLAVARHSDFVVLKLDIDSSLIENPLLQQLLSQPALQRLVDEMYFEQHVHVAEMEPPWGRKLIADGVKLTLADTYRDYAQLRRSGVRMHSWP